MSRRRDAKPLDATSGASAPEEAALDREREVGKTTHRGLVETFGIETVAEWLAEARRSRTPAQSMAAVIYFGVLLCERLRIDPAVRSRDPIIERRELISRRQIFRSIAKHRLLIAGRRSPANAETIASAFKRAQRDAGSEAGRARLRDALLSIRPEFARNPLFAAVVFGEPVTIRLDPK